MKKAYGSRKQYPVAPACARRLRVLLLVVLGLAFAPMARAQALTLTLTAHDEGPPGSHNETAYWFEAAGTSGRNPSLRLSPGSHVVVTLANAGDRPHSIHFGPPIDAASRLIDAGSTDRFEFDVPANTTGSTTYWCDAHEVIGMGGVVEFTTESTGAVGDQQRGDLIPTTFWIPLLAVGIATAASRRLKR